MDYLGFPNTLESFLMTPTAVFAEPELGAVGLDRENLEIVIVQCTCLWWTIPKRGLGGTAGLESHPACLLLQQVRNKAKP